MSVNGEQDDPKSSPLPPGSAPGSESASTSEGGSETRQLRHLMECILDVLQKNPPLPTEKRSTDTPQRTLLGVAPEEATVGMLNLPVVPAGKGKERSLKVPVDGMRKESSGGMDTGDSALPVTPAAEQVPVKGKEGSLEAFVLGEALPPVLAKLVSKILRGEFVDMAELLRDNIEAERRKGSDTQASGVGTSSGYRPARREIPDILSWVQCFGTYICVVASKYPEKVTQLLVYQTTVIREARRCGGSGWQGYDSMFRMHAASCKDMDWSKLNNSLYATTFMTQQNSRGRTCKYCLETDHTNGECALAPAREVDRRQHAAGLGIVPGAPTRNETRFDARREYGGGRDEGRRGSGPRQSLVCYSWNEGSCRFRPYCKFRHVCIRCRGDHRAMACTKYVAEKSDGSGSKDRAT